MKGVNILEIDMNPSVQFQVFQTLFELGNILCDVSIWEIYFEELLIDKIHRT